ncbi:hypothetical protein [Paenibacillus illinoisensis]|uniref:hypothetical protein n=1 Tax=Paenibacillus illinoisensis TaxID=59845 RepID=UPI000DA1DBCA|nr:hypothetical protein [Paenibacillus illinoisensis]
MKPILFTTAETAMPSGKKNKIKFKFFLNIQHPKTIGITKPNKTFQNMRSLLFKLSLLLTGFNLINLLKGGTKKRHSKWKDAKSTCSAGVLWRLPQILHACPRRILSWILEKLVMQFSENFFCVWLEIAEKRSKEISVPSWQEIENMRDQSFPSVAFKYNFDKSSSSSSIEYYHLSKNEPILNKFECPYQHESAKGEFKSMRSC